MYKTIAKRNVLDSLLMSDGSVGNDVNRGSYTSAHVLLNLLNELGKRDNMRGLPSILCLFRKRV